MPRSKTVYAGHDQKSLTIETSEITDVTYLHITIGGETHIITLTGTESLAAMRALDTRGQSRLITRY